MAALLHRKKLLLLPVALSFFAYAVSPLSFTYTHETETRNADTRGAKGADVHLLLFKLFLSALSSPHETAGEENDSVTLLLKKARAVLSKPLPSELRAPKSAAFAAAGLAGLALLSSRAPRAGRRCSPAYKQRGFYSLVSGLSPPSLPSQ